LKKIHSSDSFVCISDKRKHSSQIAPGLSMFTSSSFKELVLPLFEEFRTDFILIPSKTTSFLDFNEDLSHFLLDFGLNPTEYMNDISFLSKCRKNLHSQAQSSSNDFVKYFVEIENISKRFSINNLKIASFFWYFICLKMDLLFRTDSFDQRRSTKQSSLAFEKSNVLYNLASKISNDTINNISIDSIKSSIKDLCSSATIFDWISNNFSNAPLNDLQPNFLKLLSLLCLLQAQELSFFLSVKEEKGLKVLSRLSLGVMNLVQSIQECFVKFDTDTYLSFYDAFKHKSIFCNFIHCLIMAEFWDSQEIYEISYDLYNSSSRILGSIQCRDKVKANLEDYLKISILRSEKEKQHIYFEGKKAEDSTTKLDPYFLASVLDFRAVLNSYDTEPSALFSNIYPVSIIEYQSDFDAKANTILKTLNNESSDISRAFERNTARLFSGSDGYILELRQTLLGNNAEFLKQQLSNFDSMLKEFNINLKKLDSQQVPMHQIKNNVNNFIEDLEKSKIRLILNDKSITQVLTPLLKDNYLRAFENLQSMLKDYEESTKKERILFENLKNDVRIKYK
jgi:hypothetical protein